MSEQVQHRTARRRVRHQEQGESAERAPAGFGALRLVAAKLLLFTGVGCTLEAVERGRAGRDGAQPPGALQAARPAGWAPALLAPLAALAHLKQAGRPSAEAAAAARILDSAVVGSAVVEMGRDLLSARRRGAFPSLTPLALGAAGVLGLMLEHRERELAEERRRLERRASVVERLVPRRRARVDHIVVHV